jgi:GntR family transcriptional regulator
VARAYQQLQADGVLEVVRGMGLQVAAAAVKHCLGERQKLIRARIGQALAEARQSGLDAEELRQFVEAELAVALREGE